MVEVIEFSKGDIVLIELGDAFWAPTPGDVQKCEDEWRSIVPEGVKVMVSVPGMKIKVFKDTENSENINWGCHTQNVIFDPQYGFFIEKEYAHFRFQPGLEDIGSNPEEGSDIRLQLEKGAAPLLDCRGVDISECSISNFTLEDDDNL